MKQIILIFLAVFPLSTLANCLPQFESFTKGQATLRAQLSTYNQVFYNYGVEAAKLGAKAESLAKEMAKTPGGFADEWIYLRERSQKRELEVNQRVKTATLELENHLNLFRSCVKSKRVSCLDEFEIVDKFEVSRVNTEKLFLSAFTQLIQEIERYEAFAKYTHKHQTPVERPKYLMMETNKTIHHSRYNLGQLKITFDDFKESDKLLELRNCID